METHIYRQILNDSTIEVKPSLMETVTWFYNSYLNTINNEENAFKNIEDERVFREKFLFASEIGVNMDEDEFLHIGACNRENYFRMTGTDGSDVKPRVFSEIDIHERNALVITQWIERIKMLGVYEPLSSPFGEVAGMKIKSTAHGFIIDPRKFPEPTVYIDDKGKEKKDMGLTEEQIEAAKYTLLIKPVNDSAFVLRNKIWPENKFVKSTPINSHLSEIITLIKIHQKPLKLIYVGKNTPEMVKEFSFGISNGELIFVEEKDAEVRRTGVTFENIIKSVGEIKNSLEKLEIPARSYPKEQYITDSGVLLKMLENNFFDQREMNKLKNEEKTYVAYQCNSCRWSKICNSLPEGRF